MAKLGPVGWALLLVGFLIVAVAAFWIVFWLQIQPAQPAASPTAPLANPTALPTSARAGASPALATRPTTAAPATNIPLIGFGIVISENLNVRAEPNVQSNLVSTLKLGNIVALQKRQGSWYQLSNGAWVSALYLEVRQTQAEADSYARELLR